MGVPPSNHRALDAVIVGSGPNGLAAAIALAEAGLKIHVIEGHEKIGGGTRTTELTLPGFQHDFCSTAHPMGILSPFLSTLPLREFGLEWVQPELPVAHAFTEGEGVLLHRSVAETAAGLGRDEKTYRRYFQPIVDQLPAICRDVLKPMGAIPRSPISFMNFGLRALLPAGPAARTIFRTEEARALFAGNAAHAILPLHCVLTSGVAVLLMAGAHSVGWPFAKGGSAAITTAMAAYFKSLGGTYETGRWVKSMDDLPKAKAHLFDLNPAQLNEIAGDHLPARYRKRLGKFRHGAGTFKIDLALSGPIPWTNPDLARAGTVHLAGPLSEIEESERACWDGRHAEKPYVLLTQPTLFDPSRAPAGKHIAWAYCHVPAYSEESATERILSQIERFAPGFRETILGVHETNCGDFERYNPSYVGGDIIGGAQDWRQLVARPVLRADPYATAHPGIFLCSSSTPPGGGVHGMCGFNAARSVLRKVFHLPPPSGSSLPS